MAVQSPVHSGPSNLSDLIYDYPSPSNTHTYTLKCKFHEGREFYLIC